MNTGVKMKSSIDSPKTPGGISKSLLTPCRRVGLSRNWGKKGASPFISPLSSENSSRTPVKEEKVPKKRKICNSDDEDLSEIEKKLISTPELNNTPPSSNINSTPVRNTPLTKKKSKTLLMREKTENEDNKVKETTNVELSDVSKLVNKRSVSDLRGPVSLSRSNSKKLKREKSKEILTNESKPQDSNDTKTNECFDQNVKEKSPNNLSKECIVVIQKKMIKNLGLDKNCDTDVKISKPGSQTLFDSDDEMPLCNLGKKENITTDKRREDDFIKSETSLGDTDKKESINKVKNIDNIDKEDFTETKVKKLKDKNTSTTGLKTKPNKHKNIQKPVLDITSQNSLDDDDDFECLNKKTILIKKSYDKVVKPNKAKSTGSITQKDIDDLKARIEMKKKQLLVKAISEDTAELRNLIKKWQKGCQEALFELFDLMRKKFPDKQNMDYTEILQTLKIPPDLVGYDVDNDCFVTPDDANIILSSINT